jgi:hypothetical protein
MTVDLMDIYLRSRIRSASHDPEPVYGTSPDFSLSKRIEGVMSSDGDLKRATFTYDEVRIMLTRLMRPYDQADKTLEYYRQRSKKLGDQIIEQQMELIRIGSKLRACEEELQSLRRIVSIYGNPQSSVSPLASKRFTDLDMISPEELKDIEKSIEPR